jgi:hypothetical protein
MRRGQAREHQAVAFLGQRSIPELADVESPSAFATVRQIAALRHSPGVLEPITDSERKIALAVRIGHVVELQVPGRCSWRHPPTWFSTDMGCTQPSPTLPRSASREEYREARDSKPVLVFIQYHVDPDPAQAELTCVAESPEACRLP